MSARTLRWAGTRAFLAECASLEDVVALHAALSARPLPGQKEVLAAAETVMVAFETRETAVAGARAVAALELDAAASAAGRTVEIDVVYDGEDLAAVGELTGLGPDGVVNAHTSAAWTAAFGGFAPGFAYLVAENDPLQVPRRSTPRTAVPAGSVALAGRFSAVYPRRSPGGWQLIGRTDAPLWDLGREQPALIRPGDTVRYRPVRELIGIPGTTPEPASGTEPATAGGNPGAEGVAATAADTQRAATDTHGAEASAPGSGDPAVATSTPRALVVDDPGLQSLVQDLGRPGLGDLGVSASGAADASAARLANRLVGNAAGEAVIESVFGGLRVTARGHHVLALAGADVDALITARPAKDSGAAGDATADAATGVDGSAETAPEAASGTTSPDAGTRAPADRPAPLRTPFALYDGETLSLDAPSAGLRSYLAVRGGLALDPVLGSRSSDAMSGVGPSPLAPGTALAVGRAAAGSAVGIAEDAPAPLPAQGKTTELRFVPGPRDDWFDAAGIEALTGQEWTATSQSNRIGVRFEAPSDGRPLSRSRDGELASEGAVPGALQVPPSGLPVLFLADHPVTGGYPVVGVVVPEDLPLAAQLPPGAHVRFRLVDPDTLRPADADGPTARNAGDPGTQPAPAGATTQHATTGGNQP
ncbi:carboxyltransferase domain-containing protein [Zafaria sp. Z1313]|uniref:5-oxoprolinase subunit B/C family protein n=1 Tax=Zafaria sp. Z1313 TaxID=3423202 RepID=UPI003D301E6C